MINNLQKYPTYKDSGVEWLGEIPTHWETKRIKFLFQIGRGRVIAQIELDDEGTYPVYSSQTLNNGVLGYIKTYDFDCTQITWTTDGANAGTIFLRKGKHNCTNVCGTLKPINNDFLIEFTKYALEIASQFYKRPDTNGAKIMNGEMAAIFVTFPPLPEQTAIAAFLDRKTALIDQAIDIKQKQIELLKERRQILIHKAVTRGLNPNVKMKDSGVEWIGEIPEGWEVKRLKYVANLISLKQTSKGNSLNYIGLENIESWTGKYFSTETETEGLANYFKKGDILFGKLRPYLAKVYLAEIEGICSTEFLVFRSREVMFNWYLHLLMLSFEFIKLIDSSTYGSKMPRANSEFIVNQLIPIPSKEEQIEIVQYIEKATTKIDTAISLKEQEIEMLKEYKATLINSAVTGKIKVV
jgi:type I restriction enzyme S subunit